MDIQCPVDGGSLVRSEDVLTCSSCGTAYQVVDDVPLLVPPTLTAQHEHQREYFDSEFAGFDEYRVDDWRKSFNDRMFSALRIGGNGAYLDVGVGGSGATVIEAARAGTEAAGCDLSVEGVLRAARFAEEQGLGEHTTF